MAKDKNAQSKSKEMFQPYNPKGVPDIMPFPDVARIATTRGQEIAVPKLNEDQRSWIFDVALRGSDLASLTGKAALAFYEKVKTDAFAAKAFQHHVRPQDRAEEAALPKLVAAWKKKHPPKNVKAGSRAGKKDDDDENENDDAEDAGNRNFLLRGYTKTGWRIAIQKVLSNRRTDEKRKGKRPPRQTNRYRRFPLSLYQSCSVSPLTPVATNSAKIATTKSPPMSRLCQAQWKVSQSGGYSVGERGSGIVGSGGCGE
ncbi:hypothetical protein B0H11DRAFT_1076999 [Mycena galericulata]|nr:hypothetical protein B0H11DRAFT_1076999 [Mycena galericulata]